MPPHSEAAPFLSRTDHLSRSDDFRDSFRLSAGLPAPTTRDVLSRRPLRHPLVSGRVGFGLTCGR
jgi:hypothetical protein